MSEASSSRSLIAYQILGSVVVGLLVIGMGGWASVAAISAAVIAPGVVSVDGHAKKVQHLDGGIVSEILVRNSDRVEAGAVLLRLDETDARASLQILQSQVEELSARRARLRAELNDEAELAMPENFSSSDPALKQIWADQAKLLKSRREVRHGKEQQLKERAEQMRQVVVGLEAQRKAEEQQLHFIRDELDGMAQLREQQLVTKDRLSALQREAARLEGERGKSAAEIARTNVQISETALQLVEYRQQMLSDLLTEQRETEAKLAETIEKANATAARLKRLAVIAPQAGIVHKLAIHTIGGVVTPGEAILEIVPQEEALVLDGQIDPAHIDDVFVGQPVVIRLVALNQEKTPEVEGTVASIAPDVRQDAPQLPHYYATRVRIAEKDLPKVAGKLVPGMPVELLIRGSDRTVLTYLVKPLSDRIAHTFREN